MSATAISTHMSVNNSALKDGAFGSVIDRPTRVVYSTRCQDGSPSKACYVKTCIQVRVGKPTTRLAGEAMFETQTFFATCRAGLGRVHRIDVYDLDAYCFGLVFDKGL